MDLEPRPITPKRVLGSKSLFCRALIRRTGVHFDGERSRPKLSTTRGLSEGVSTQAAFSAIPQSSDGGDQGR